MQASPDGVPESVKDESAMALKKPGEETVTLTSHLC